MFKVILFLVLWSVSKSFLVALLLFIVLWLIHFTVMAFWGLVREFGLFTSIVMLITFSWLFDGGDD